MAVDLMSSPKIDDQTAIREAASQGIKGLEHLVRLFSHPQPLDCSDHTVSSFRKVISLLNRTGHARFRRGPVHSSSPHPASPKLTPVPVVTHFVQSQPQSLTLDFTKPSIFSKSTELEFSKDSFSMSSCSSFMSSAITGDGSVSNGKLGQPLFLTPAPAVSAGKPPHKKRCHEHVLSDDISGDGKCRCSKRRKNRVKKTIRVPAISSKVANIPADEHSWRKYGQKPIKGSPYPRGYYKCSTVRGCPARKHVERAVDDPAMLIVTYEGEHKHASSISGGGV